MQNQPNNVVIVAIIASFIGGLAAINALLLFGAYPDLSEKPYYQDTIKILYDWQSLIGVIFSSGLAFFLFQWQRKLDRRAAQISRSKMAEAAYRSIHNKLNKSFLHQQRNRLVILKILPNAKPEELAKHFEEIAFDLGVLEDFCQRELARVTSIPRDEHLTKNTRENIEWLEHNLVAWIESSKRDIRQIKNTPPDYNSLDQLRSSLIPRIKEIEEISKGAEMFLGINSDN